MPNLSQLKRKRMLEFLAKIKEEHKNDDEMLIALGEIENELNLKKYGLVWEEHEENVDVKMRTHIPVFSEVKEREISVAPDKPYNFLLEGDNLHSLYLLEKTHKGKIDVIYIDPPYNRGKDDFVYEDNYIDTTDSFRHSKWLSFMYERLVIAQRLLAEDGVIFISIDENEFAQMKLLCDDIFGESNFVECIVWNKRVPKNDKGIGNIHEYILLYLKSYQSNNGYKYMMPKDGLDEIFDFVEKLKKEKVPLKESEDRLKAFYKKKGYDRAITLYCQLDNDYNVFGKINMCWPNGNSIGPMYEVTHPTLGCPVQIPSRGWRWTETTFNENAGYQPQLKQYLDKQILFDGSVLCKGTDKNTGVWFSNKPTTQPSSVKYLRDLNRMLFRSIYSTKSDGSIVLDDIIGEQNIFSYPKPPKLIYDLLDSVLYNKRKAIVLDFFAGSGTTGEAVLKLNKDNGKDYSFILCTDNECNAFQKLKYLHDNGYLLDYKPAKTSEIKSVEAKIKTYLDANNDIYQRYFVNTRNFETYGICQYVTYPRIKTVITGKRADSSVYADGIPANLKYYRTDFVSRDEEFLSDALLEHIAEMIQLEHGVKIDGSLYRMLMSDAEADELQKHFKEQGPIKALYISKNVLLTTEQLNTFEGIEIHIIPDNYFKFELKEEGQAW